MTKHALLAITAAILFSTSSGCVWWRHCWGSWAYYGTENSCGYRDNCPPGPCATQEGPFCGLFSGCCLFEQCDAPCGGCANPGCCPPDTNYTGYCGNDGCCGNSCGPCGECDECCAPFAFLHKLFYSPGPVGCQDYACKGCGESYFCDWFNSPPTCDPCDCCGNYVGCKDPRPCYQQSPRFGSIPLHAGHVMETPVEHVPQQAPVEHEYIEPQTKRSRSQTPGVQRAAFRGQRPAGILSR